MPSLNGLSGSLWEGFGAASDPAMASTFWMAVATFCYTEAGVELKYFVLFSLDIYYVHICTHKHIKFIYQKSHTCFCKDCISLLSHKTLVFVWCLQILRDQGLKSRGFAGQFGHLLCRGQSGRSYGSQWQLALGTTKHGTVAWKTSLTLFVFFFSW